VLLAEAQWGRGVPEIAAAIEAHRAYLAAEGRMGALRRERARRELLDRLRDRLLADALARLEGAGRLERLVVAIAAREVDPDTAVDRIVEGGWQPS
jgi:LAO/AO transport system kinase